MISGWQDQPRGSLQLPSQASEHDDRAGQPSADRTDLRREERFSTFVSMDASHDGGSRLHQEQHRSIDQVFKHQQYFVQWKLLNVIMVNVIGRLM